MANKKGGRPSKQDDEKLCHSINLKLTSTDLKIIRDRAAKIGLTATQYARIMTLKGVVKSRFSVEELDLMRKVAGVSNNVNQIAKGLNSNFERFKIEAYGIIMYLKQLIDDSKKH